MSIAMARWVPAWMVAAALGVGVLGDTALRAGLAGLATALLVAATSGVLLASGRVVSLQGRLLVAAAPAFGVWTMLRSTGWLIPLDLVAAFGLTLLGVSLSRGGSVADLPFVGLAGRAWHAFLHGLAALELPIRALRRRDRRPRNPITGGLVRGALLALPLLLLFGVLLGSGDAVFASFVSVDVNLDPADAIGHLIVIAMATWVFLWLLRVACAQPPAPLPGVKARLGAIETTVVLGSVIALFGAFAVTQAIAVIGGDDYVQRTTGLTYAEYARSGFFQLLWVAALTVAALLLLRGVADVAAAPRRFAVLFGLVCALTVLIVAVAVRRLALYSDVFGLTMLRLYSTLFAVWIGAVLVLLAVRLARSWARAWFPAAAAGCGLALLLGLNVLNPEAFVATTNLQRVGTLGPDVSYLGGLSDDAVPAIVALLPELDDLVARNELTRQVCARAEPRSFTGWTAWNNAHARADAARAELCRR